MTSTTDRFRGTWCPRMLGQFKFYYHVGPGERRPGTQENELLSLGNGNCCLQKNLQYAPQTPLIPTVIVAYIIIDYVKSPWTGMIIGIWRHREVASKLNSVNEVYQSSTEPQWVHNAMQTAEQKWLLVNQCCVVDERKICLMQRLNNVIRRTYIRAADPKKKK